MNSLYHEYEVVQRISYTPSVTCLWLSKLQGALPDFIPGQFVNVLLPSQGSDAKSYTIGSTPRDPCLALTIRSAGAFSSALSSHSVGQVIKVSEPSGYFYPIDNLTPRICIGGGIGIMPFASFIRASIEEGASPPTLLLYSSRSAGEIIFYDAFSRLAQSTGNFFVRYFITREKGTLAGAAYERIGVPHLAEAASRYKSAHFFLCGSIEFVRDMWLNLKSLGVPEESIFTEAFY